MPTALRRLLLPIIFATLPGCFWVTTKHEGMVLRAEVNDLKTRTARQEQFIDEKIKTLDDSVDRATSLLARNSADLGAEVQKLARDLAALTGNIATISQQVSSLHQDVVSMQNNIERYRSDSDYRLTHLQSRVETVEKSPSPMLPPSSAIEPPNAPLPDKDALYDSAHEKLLAGQYAEARKDFRSFVQRFPQDRNAEKAQYWIGETFFREQQYEKAIVELQRVIDQYPDGDMVDDAFFQAGMAAFSMKWCADARAYFGVLSQKYPASPFAKQAADKLAWIKKNVKNKQMCTT